MSVFSEGKDRGSIFRVELPVYNTVKNRRTDRLLKLTQRMRRQMGADEGDEHGRKKQDPSGRG